MVSRRNFLQLGGMAMAGGLAIGRNLSVFGQIADNSPYFRIPANVYSDKAASLNRQLFEPLLNTNFSFIKNDIAEDSLNIGKRDPALSLRLVEVTSNDQTKKQLSRRPIENFSLIFEDTKRREIADNIYSVSHPELGTFSMFISTVGRSESRYQAVFNRIYL